MRIVSIGGGPAGLYTSILLKKALPQASISVYERNRADDTFGWGVVFSSETLSGFELADAPSYRRITEEFRYWDDIETYALGECVRSTGHGFCGMSRRKLLMILQERAAELGVELLFETDVPGVDAFADASLILGADGIHSQVRAQFEDRFQPSFDWRKCKFAWFGTSRPLDAFTFHFKQNEHGLWRVHAYPFDDGLSTWIVECREETWRRAGLDEADEAQSVEYCQELFRDELDGHPLLVNKSVWRTFPTIRCERWYHGNVVLLGDAVHTAHFSIGSGTKLAMEDGIALAEAFIANDGASVPQVLEAYQEARFVETLKLQKAAQTSLEWFENTERYMQQDPVTFSFNLMTRSKRITYENLAKRDPQLVRAADRVFGEREGSPPPRGWQLRAADVRAVSPPRARAAQPHRRQPDVPVLGGGGRAAGLASRAPRVAGDRWGRARADRDDGRRAPRAASPRAARGSGTTSRCRPGSASSTSCIVRHPRASASSSRTPAARRAARIPGIAARIGL
jgi:anthraniloyl-CoA monooxygenase